MILVDTNVWSELTKARGDRAVLAWLEANDADLALSTLVIAEIRYGIELAGAADKRSFLQPWLAGLESRYWGQTLVFGPQAAHQYGRIAARPEVKARKPQIIDMQIAAQAQEHGIPIATRNAKDFEWIGVKLIDPWAAPLPA
ncbi:MAG: PIN domain-containing protein [Novosphingobium sp.]